MKYVPIRITLNVTLDTFIWIARVHFEHTLERRLTRQVYKDLARIHAPNQDQYEFPDEHYMLSKDAAREDVLLAFPELAE